MRDVLRFLCAVVCGAIGFALAHWIKGPWLSYCMIGFFAGYSIAWILSAPGPKGE